MRVSSHASHFLELSSGFLLADTQKGDSEQLILGYPTLSTV
jgi:hypothetical protein